MQVLSTWMYVLDHSFYSTIGIFVSLKKSFKRSMVYHIYSESLKERILPDYRKRE